MSVVSWHLLGFVCVAASRDALCACPAVGCLKPGLRARPPAGLPPLGPPGGRARDWVLYLGALFGCFFGGAFSSGGRCPVRRRLATCKGLPFLSAHLP